MSRIIQALNECLAALPQQALRKVCAIGVSGQMHGVMFWKTGQGMPGSGGDHTLHVIITVEPEKCCRQLPEGPGYPAVGMKWHMLPLIFCVLHVCHKV